MEPNNNPGCLFGFLSLLFGRKSEKKPDKTMAQAEEISQEAKLDAPDTKNAKRTDYTDCYQPKYLLTKNEWYAHKKLKEIADQKGFIICPKVRMLDIIEPRKEEKDWKALFYKIQAKHVDFVICDSTMHIKGVIELDDSSHNQKERKDRDTFVDEVLQSVGYTVIHTKYINDNILDSLTNEETK